MSASREKKLRKQAPEEKKKVNTPRHSGGLIKGLIGTAVVVLLVALFVAGTGVLQGSLAATKINGVRISAAEYNFVYARNYMGFLQTYGSYASSFGLDINQSLRSQSFSEEETWEEYFSEGALSTLRSIVARSEEARKAGITLTAEDVETVDIFMEDINAAAEAYGLKPDKYLKDVYGAGVTVKNIRKYVERQVLADRWSSVQNEDIVISSEQVETYYDENKNEYDTVDYRIYEVDVEEPEEAETEEGADEEQAEDEQSEAEQKAIESARAEANYYLESIGTESDDASELLERQSYTSGDEVSEWLFSAERKAGDKAVIANDEEAPTVFSVVSLIKRERPEYDYVAVRHILVNAEDEETEEDEAVEGDEAVEDDEAAEELPSESAYAKALEEANAIMDEWNKDPTEDNFGQLAYDKTDDTSSASSGGLYEGFAPGEMVPEFDAWSFDPARKEGDTGIVKTKFGYHLMYFVANEGPYWYKEIEDTLASEEYNSRYNSILENYDEAKGGIFLKVFQLKI